MYVLPTTDPGTRSVCASSDSVMTMLLSVPGCVGAALVATNVLAPAGTSCRPGCGLQAFDGLADQRGRAVGVTAEVHGVA